MALVLASSSPIRKALLQQAGVDFTIAAVDIDEGKVKERRTGPDDVARVLAENKALAGAAARPGDWSVGSDSVVSVGGRLFSKPADKREAAEHLRAFSGRMMALTSAVALARGKTVDWSFCDTAQLKVRTLSDGFICDYLEAEWPQVSYCVGVFRMEGRGVQLFESVEGSHFTILGMPLLPLLGALRERGLVPE